MLSISRGRLHRALKAACQQSPKLGRSGYWKRNPLAVAHLGFWNIEGTPVTTIKRLTLKVAQVFSVFAFVGALVGLFTYGNYLMIGGHRPFNKASSQGFVYPIPGKGGAIYVSLIDVKVLVGLVAVVAISMISANRVARVLSS